MGLSLPDPKWISIPANIVGALDIKGYRRGAYYYSKFFNTYVGWDEHSHDRFILIVYQNQNDLMCEIRTMGNSSNPTSTTIDPDIIRKFHDSFQKAWRNDFVITRLEEIEGRMFIHGLSHKIPHHTHYGIDMIEYMFAGRIVECFGNKLAVAIRWNEKLPKIYDVYNVCDKLISLSYTSKAIKNKNNNDMKKTLLKSISYYRKEIDKMNGEMEKICELSANAMNTLSEKYGIEISI